MNSIPIIVDDHFSKTTWFGPTFSGFQKTANSLNMQVEQISINELSSYEKHSVIVLATNSTQYLEEILKISEPLHLRLLLMCSEINASDYGVSNISTERKRSAAVLTESMYHAGAKRIAFIGLRSGTFTDTLRLHGWSEALSHISIPADEIQQWRFDYVNNVQDTIRMFLDSPISFSAAVCTNDYCALELVVQARKRGIRIPEELMVSGYGNSHICCFSRPSITSVSLNLYEAGKQSLALYRYLLKNPQVLYSSSAITWNIVFRDSAPASLLDTSYKYQISDPNLSRVPIDNPYHALNRLEYMLRELDELDVQIINEIVKGTSYEKIPEKLFLSESAFKYRLQRIRKNAGIKKKNELAEAIRTFLPDLSPQSFTRSRQQYLEELNHSG